MSPDASPNIGLLVCLLDGLTDCMYLQTWGNIGVTVSILLIAPDVILKFDPDISLCNADTLPHGIFWARQDPSC